MHQTRMLIYCLFKPKDHENSLRVLPNMDVNLSLVQIQLIENSLRILQTWMLIYCLFKLKDHENSLRVLPNMDVNLSLVQIQLIENSLRMHQTWMLIYCLFKPKDHENSLRVLPNTDANSDPQLIDVPDMDTFLILTYNIQFDKHSRMTSLSPSPTRFCHISK